MPYIIIEGVIGVGKTALTCLLGARLRVPTLFEQFEENPFLARFYEDRARYAFQTELFFLLNRYRQQQTVKDTLPSGGDLVADYLFAKTNLFAGLNLHGDELALFRQTYDALNEMVCRPDLVVYLQAAPDTLMARICLRDRSFERSMDRNYIVKLADLYHDFFSTYSGAPLLQVDTDDLDIVCDPTAQQQIIDLINGKLAALPPSTTAAG